MLEDDRMDQDLMGAGMTNYSNMPPEPPPERQRSSESRQKNRDPEEKLEDWSDGEDDDLIKKFDRKHYKPYVNGLINTDFVDAHVSKQKTYDAAGDAKKQNVPLILSQDRKKRIVDLDKSGLDKARECFTADKNFLEESIAKYGDEVQPLLAKGEEIVTSLDCVAFLNAPQCYKDLKGHCKLFLTRRLATVIEDAGLDSGKTFVNNNFNSGDVEAQDKGTGGQGTVEHQRYYYRMFFYSYEEIPEHQSTDIYTDLKGWWFDLTRWWTCSTKKRKSYDLHIADRSRRVVKSAFISINLEDVLSVYHESNDITMMSKDLHNLPTKEEDDKDNCCTACCGCTPSILCGELEIRSWEWGFSAKAQQLSDLSYMISGTDAVIDRQENVSMFNPIDKKEVTLKMKTTEACEWTRFHTINLTYADGVEYSQKHKGVIVVAPFEDTKLAIDFVCQLTAIVEDSMMRHRALKRRKFALMKLDNNDPMNRYKHILNPSGPFSDLLSDIFGGTNIKLQLTYYYKLTYHSVWIFSLIACATSFAITANDTIMVLPGLFGLVTLAEKVYYIRSREYTNFDLKKDIGFGGIGLLIFIVAVTSSTDSSSTQQAALAFTFLQILFRFVGIYMVFHSKIVKGEGPEAGEQIRSAISAVDLD